MQLEFILTHMLSKKDGISVESWKYSICVCLEFPLVSIQRAPAPWRTVYYCSWVHLCEASECWWHTEVSVIQNNSVCILTETVRLHWGCLIDRAYSIAFANKYDRENDNCRGWLTQFNPKVHQIGKWTQRSPCVTNVLSSS